MLGYASQSAISDPGTRADPTNPSDAIPSIAVVRFAWFTVFYVGAVILLGDLVRITDSGAGCGNQWPRCQGGFVHVPQRFETVVELSHRLTSALTIPLTAVLYWLARRNFGARHAVRRFAAMAIGFILVESLVGAVIVLFGLVVGDRSLGRALVMPLHLANATLLMATLSLTAFGMTHRMPHWTRRPSSRERTVRLVLLALLVSAMLGAVTALSDTLFPPRFDTTAWEHMVTDQYPATHWLQRVRFIHPLVAMAAALFTIQFGVNTTLAPDASPTARTLAKALGAVVIVQILAGLTNIWASSPAALQVTHLALALLTYDLAALLWAALAA